MYRIAGAMKFPGTTEKIINCLAILREGNNSCHLLLSQFPVCPLWSATIEVAVRGPVTGRSSGPDDNGFIAQASTRLQNHPGNVSAIDRPCQ